MKKPTKDINSNFDDLMKLINNTAEKVSIDEQGLEVTARTLAERSNITYEWAYLKTKISVLANRAIAQPETLEGLNTVDPKSAEKLQEYLCNITNFITLYNNDSTKNLGSHDFFGFDTAQEKIDPRYFKLISYTERNLLQPFNKLVNFYKSRKPYLAYCLDQVGLLSGEDKSSIAFICFSFMVGCFYNYHCLHEFSNVLDLFEYVYCDLKKLLDFHASLTQNKALILY